MTISPSVRVLGKAFFFSVALMLTQPAAAIPGTTSFTFEITNNSSATLVFRLDSDNQKNIHISNVSGDSVTVKAGAKGTLVLEQNNFNGCNAGCGKDCTDSKGRINVYYQTRKNAYDMQPVKERMNNYYKVAYFFSQYCDRETTTFSTNWEFEHHKGDGDNYYTHKQSSKTPTNTSGSGFEYRNTDAKATITYSNP